MPRTLQKTAFHSQRASAQLLELIQKYDPQARVKTSFGFHFANLSLFKGKREIHFPNTVFHEKSLDEALQFAHQQLQKANITPQDKVLYKQILASEYKIHLMPKADYIFPVLDIILQACQKDPNLSNYINCIKIIANPLTKKEILEQFLEKQNKQYMPQIVIFLAQDKEAFLTPEKQQALVTYVLNCLYQVFKEFDLNELSIGEPARFSKPVTPLLFYAQSPGDFKPNTPKNPQEFNVQEDIYSQELVHVNLEKQHLPDPCSVDLKKLSEILAVFQKLPFIKVHNLKIEEGCKNTPPRVCIDFQVPGFTQDHVFYASSYIVKIQEVLKIYQLQSYPEYQQHNYRLNVFLSNVMVLDQPNLTTELFDKLNFVLNEASKNPPSLPGMQPTYKSLINKDLQPKTTPAAAGETGSLLMGTGGSPKRKLSEDLIPSLALLRSNQMRSNQTPEQQIVQQLKRRKLS